MGANQKESDRIAEVYRNRPDLGLYSVFRASHLYMLQEVERGLLGLLATQDWSTLKKTRVLDVGCGNGYWLRRMIDWGGEPQNLSGIDILPEHIDAARAHLPSGCNVQVGDATALPWEDGSFDIVSQFVMFSSVLDSSIRKRIAAEMVRVLHRKGCLLWYDFTVDNPNNKNVTGIKLREIESLFEGCTVHTRKVTVAPPLARKVSSLSPRLCRRLEAFPFLKTHLVAIVRRKSA